MEYHDIILPFEKFHLPERRVTGGMPQIVREFNSQVEDGVYRLYWNKCLCGSTEFDLIASVDKKGFLAPLAVCRHCGTMIMTPRYTDVFYTDLRNHRDYFPTFFGYEHPRDYVLAKYNHLEGADIFKLVKHVVNITSETTVLELGAGAGWNLLPFVNAGAQVVGYEQEKDFVELAQSLGMNIQLLALNNLPEQGGFDVLILSGVINRITTPLDFLQKAITLVKEGGVIYIDVPLLNMRALDYRVDWFYYFSEDSFRYFIAESGLKPLEVRIVSGRVSGVFRREEFPNSKYLLTRNKAHTYKDLRRLRRRENWHFSKKLKTLTHAPIFRVLEKDG